MVIDSPEEDQHAHNAVAVILDLKQGQVETGTQRRVCNTGVLEAGFRSLELDMLDAPPSRRKVDLLCDGREGAYRDEDCNERNV